MTSDIPPGISGYHHLNLTVSDLERSATWYCDVLGFTKVREFKRELFRRAFLLHRDSRFFMGLTCHTSHAPKSAFSEFRVGMDHVAFAVPDRRALEIWAGWLTDLGVTHSGIKEATTGGVITLRDPDNIQVELYAPADDVYH